MLSPPSVRGGGQPSTLLGARFRSSVAATTPSSGAHPHLGTGGFVPPNWSPPPLSPPAAAGAHRPSLLELDAAAAKWAATTAATAAPRSSLMSVVRSAGAASGYPPSYHQGTAAPHPNANLNGHPTYEDGYSSSPAALWLSNPLASPAPHPPPPPGVSYRYDELDADGRLPAPTPVARLATTTSTSPLAADGRDVVDAHAPDAQVWFHVVPDGSRGGQHYRPHHYHPSPCMGAAAAAGTPVHSSTAAAMPWGRTGGGGGVDDVGAAAAVCGEGERAEEVSSSHLPPAESSSMSMARRAAPNESLTVPRSPSPSHKTRHQPRDSDETVPDGSHAHRLQQELAVMQEYLQRADFERVELDKRHVAHMRQAEETIQAQHAEITSLTEQLQWLEKAKSEHVAHAVDAYRSDVDRIASEERDELMATTNLEREQDRMSRDAALCASAASLDAVRRQLADRQRELTGIGLALIEREKVISRLEDLAAARNVVDGKLERANRDTTLAFNTIWGVVLAVLLSLVALVASMSAAAVAPAVAPATAAAGTSTAKGGRRGGGPMEAAGSNKRAAAHRGHLEDTTP